MPCCAAALAAHYQLTHPNPTTNQHQNFNEKVDVATSPAVGRRFGLERRDQLPAAILFRDRKVIFEGRSRRKSIEGG